MSEKAKPSPEITPGNELKLGGLTIGGGIVGEQRNYNLDPGITQYELWPYSTITWVPEKNKYRARVIIQHKATFDAIVFNSWHEGFADAERAIELVDDSLSTAYPKRLVYNIFGETIAVNIGGGPGEFPSVTEVLVLIWSMQRRAGS
jgi:hypothetical protein